MPVAEIITVGDELLSGETVDTNANYLDGRLELLGWEVGRHTTVADDLDQIAEVVRRASERAELVLVSGGLGPTEDDLTMAALAQALGCELRKDEEVLAAIAERFRSFGREMTPNNERQAMVPERGEALENRSGTAPGFVAELGQARIFLLPGVPREVRWLVEHQVGPRIDLGAPLICRRTLKVIGFGESRLEHTVKDVVRAHRDRVRFGYRALGVENHIKLAARGERAVESIAAAEAALRESLGDRIFGTDDQEIAGVLKDAMLEAKATVSTAESCTGGWVGKMLTDAPGSSAYYVGGIVAYANAVKLSLLGVSTESLDAHGAVSEVVAKEMASGAKARFGTDYALSATGIAGPEGGTEDKPVGTVFIAIAGPTGVEGHELHLPGDREMIRMNTATLLLDMLRRAVRP